MTSLTGSIQNTLEPAPKPPNVRGDASTNVAESYFAQLKRSIDGTHHNVSVEHLPRYLAEYDFRFSTRALNDTTRMEKLLGQVGGKRLSYEPLRRY